MVASTRAKAMQTAFENEPAVPLYDEPYHKLTKDTATWPPAGYDLSSLWVWAVVKCDEIPHKTRYSAKITLQPRERL